jgi:uridine phosphorylase
VPITKIFIIYLVQKIKKSELIINSDGSIYHLKLRPEHLADTVILVGDPDRVPLISGYFDRIEYKIRNREIITHTGFLNKKRLTVMSTGIGPDNIDIVLNELDALVNIDFKTRQVKDDFTSLDIIRVGTSGAIQKNVEIDDFVLAEYALGLDGLLYFYEDMYKVVDQDIQDRLANHFKDHNKLPLPYMVPCSSALLDKFGKRWTSGITVTAPGFYGPQGRSIRLKQSFPDLIDKLRSFEYREKRILNFEMEASAIYGLSAMLGHRALTVCAILANRITNQYSKNPRQTIKRLIERVLGILDG